MAVTRREFVIGGVGAIAGVRLLAPMAARAGDGVGQTVPDPALRRSNRLVVIFLSGGNDGLNTVIPTADVGRDKRFSVYRKVRPSIAVNPGDTLPLDRFGDADQKLGLHPSLRLMHRLYRQKRLAIVQGVDYPNHNYSHFTSTDIWQSGRPESVTASGWLGRHLDRVGIPDGALRGVGFGFDLPLIMQGDERRGTQITELDRMRFADGSEHFADARHAALRRFAGHPVTEPLRRLAGKQVKGAVELVHALEAIEPPPPTPNYFANTMLSARTLLEGDFGVESVFLYHYGSYDTHATQAAIHGPLLRELEQGIEVFLFGTLDGAAVGNIGALDPRVADRTLILIISEFGRRIAEAGAGEAAGTDHGAAGPVFLIGPRADSRRAGARLQPGLHGDHPSLGTPVLPAEDLLKTTELRRLYQSVLQAWLSDPDPAYERAYRPLAGLFS